MTTLPEDQRLQAISPRAFEHPADRAATAALKRLPMLDTVVRKLVELGYERALRQELLAGAVRVGPGQLPRVWADHQAAHARLDLPDDLALYVTQYPFANAAAIGAGRPVVVLNSAALGLLDELELRAVLGHEAAHVLADHVLYRTALLIVLRLTGAGLRGLPGLPLLGAKLALLEWFRAAELSADRASALVTRDPLAVCRTLMVLAGGRRSAELDLDAFVAQAAEYEDWDSGWDRLSRLQSELWLDHAHPVRRLRELMRWVHAGDYDRIMGGHYLRRGEEPPASEEARDATDFYTERFRAFFREAGDMLSKAGDSLADASDKVSDWLRRSGR
jgi:Zn-dependent protease with chaperone function